MTLSCIVGLIALLMVQRSAQRMLSASESLYDPPASVTPLLDLTNVDLRGRQGGHAILSLKAAALTLFRDLRTAQVQSVTDGIILQNGRPALLFSAGQADFSSAPGNFAGGTLLLHNQVNADVLTSAVPVHMTTAALNWQWPSGVVKTEGPISSTVGNLGMVTCLSLEVNPTSRSIDFTGLHVTAKVPELLRLAASESAPAESSAAKDDESNNVTVDAPGGGHWDEQARKFTVRGPVTFKQGDATMQTVGAVYDRNTNIAQAMAPVKIYDSLNILTGTNGSVDFAQHVATLTGDVTLKSTPDQSKTSKSDESLDSEATAPTQLVCDHLTYNYRTKLADADGKLKITQTNRTVTADRGHYDANSQVANLIGNVDAHSDDGKDIKSPIANVSLKKGNEYIEVPGPITAVFSIPNEDKAKLNSSSSTGKAPAAAPDAPASPTVSTDAPSQVPASSAIH